VIKGLFFVFLVLWSLPLAAFTDTVYVQTALTNMGNYDTYRTTFSKSPVFQKNNDFLYADIGEELTVTVINLDTVAHNLSWHDGMSEGLLSAGGSLSVTRTFSSLGTYGLFLTDFMGDRLGAFLPICIGLENENHSLWNFWEMEQFISADIANGILNEIPADYRPDIYTINAYHYPTTQVDTLGLIEGTVGDSIYISMINAGNMVHSIHFHGFHVEIVQITKENNRLQWKKDSVPFVENETATLLLVADKPGNYPVHDHNLISVLTNNTYPGGMISMIHIAP
jgi:plastocyanin